MLKRSQLGMTLIELMVALLISLVVTGVVIQIFISNRITFQLQDSLAKVQESGRLSVQYLAREIREAGSGLEFAIGAVPTACVVDKDVCDGALVSALSGKVATAADPAILGSDIITIGRGDGCDAQLEGVYKPNTANFKASKYCDSMTQGSILMLVDFENAVIFSVNNNPTSNNITVNHAGPENVVSNKLGGVVFNEGARVVGFSNMSYFVRDTGVADSTGTNIRALSMRNNLAANPAASVVDLVDGIEDMRVYYGIPVGTELDYRRANELASDDWAEVRAVKIDLLVVSDSEAPGADEQAVTFDGSLVAADNRFRQVYSTVAAVRNRID
ncbi:PilW family protein [Halopseudomonas nanhaiensis]|uniref:PilW family protein n=1 Tax=Halopseudomonas nanhaiensis TaxID=2830842 RepID=UPI001CC02919|nr:PilW family protein [Halopseudomonas nanhaiensis]UAW99021.1 PilW family protein [Halopseudomonas nanhaiensis]